MNITATVITAIITGLVSFVMGSVLSYFTSKGKRAIEREKATSDGMRELLRSRLIEYHDKYTEKGFCPIYAKESATNSYKAYHNLGGNGVITKLYNDIMALPEEAPKGERRGCS